MIGWVWRVCMVDRGVLLGKGLENGKVGLCM